MTIVAEMTFDELVEAAPSLRLDIMDRRLMSERRKLHAEFVAEATRRGVLESWSYAVRTRS